MPSFAGSHSRRCATSASAATRCSSRRSAAIPKRRRDASCSSSCRPRRPTTRRPPRAPSPCSPIPIRPRRCATKPSSRSRARSARLRIPPSPRSRSWSRRIARLPKLGSSRSSCCAISIRCRRGSSMQHARRSTRARPACALPRCRSTRARSIPSAPAAISRRCSTTRSSRSCSGQSPGGSAEGGRRRRITAAAEHALDAMNKDEDPDIRAAAATASGKLGRTYQDRLIKMAKGENYNVRIGAAEGLAATTLSGGNVGVGIDGIAQLWREEGWPRRAMRSGSGRTSRARRHSRTSSSTSRAPRRSPRITCAAPGRRRRAVQRAALAGSAEARAALQEIHR